jgi:starch phosphorylase
LPANLPALLRLREHAGDTRLLDALTQIKLSNKRRLVSIVRQATGLELNPSALFLVQAKRIHEYKRQLLTCLAVIAHYLRLKQKPALVAEPRVYLFAGKAAAGYYMAKQYIRLIHDIAATVNGDPDTADRLQVAFIPNYGVTLAQAIIPAADLSLQISQAGMEASGTSNMKFALNGALTLGTLDGANIELRDAVGHDNFFAFGLQVDQVRALRASYDPAAFIARSSELRAAIDLLDSDFFALGDATRYAAVVEQLRVHDPYMVCADFEAYLAMEAKAAALHADDPREWSRRALFNIAGGSAFSSDATVGAYAAEIWRIAPVAPGASGGRRARDPADS